MPLVVVEQKSHLTKLEKSERKRQEPKPPEGAAKAFHAPGWLPQDLRSEFNELRTKLVERGLMEELDKDTLAQYIMERDAWFAAFCQARDFIGQGDGKEASLWSATASSHFKACRSLAGDLGLSMTSRCKLVLPAGLDKPPESAFEKLMRERERRNA